MAVENHYRDVVSVGLIGSGSFGKLYKAVDTETGEQYALKVISVTKINELEKDVHTRGNPEFIARAHFTGKDSKNMYILQDLFAGDLTVLPSVSTTAAAYIAHQIGRGITYLHELEVVHRDIKPQNILVTWDYVVKITDFGFCTRPGPNERIKGTPGYIPIEAFQGADVSFLFDWYAFGCVVFYLVCEEEFDSSNSLDTAIDFHQRCSFVQRCGFVKSIPMRDYIQKFVCRSARRKTYRESLSKLRDGPIASTQHISHDEFLTTNDLKPVISAAPMYIPEQKMLDKPFFNDGETWSDALHAAKFRKRKSGRFKKTDTIALFRDSPRRSPKEEFVREAYNLRVRS